MKKPTIKNLAKYYGFHRNSIQNFKKSRPVLYKVMVEHFIKEQEKQKDQK